MGIFNSIFSVISTLFGVVGSILAGILTIVSYFLLAIGLSKMAKREGLKHSWLAWIPLFNLYLVGELVGNKVLGVSNAKWILIIAPIVIGILGSFINSEFVLGFLTAAYYLYTVCAYYKLYKIYSPGNAILFTLLGALISPLKSVFVFIIRDNPRQALINER